MQEKQEMQEMQELWKLQELPSTARARTVGLDKAEKEEMESNKIGFNETNAKKISGNKTNLGEKKSPDLSKLNMIGKYAKIKPKGVNKACVTETKDKNKLQKQEQQEQNNVKSIKNGDVMLEKNEEQTPAVETGWLARARGWLNKMLKPLSSLCNTILAETKDKALELAKWKELEVDTKIEMAKPEKAKMEEEMKNIDKIAKAKKQEKQESDIKTQIELAKMEEEMKNVEKIEKALKQEKQESDIETLIGLNLPDGFRLP